MFTFILITSAITIMALFFLVKPLLNKEDLTDTIERRSQNIHFAKQRLHELKEQSENGEISEQAYLELRKEIEQTLADDIDIQKAEQEQTEADSTSNKGLISLLCIALPLLAFGIYQVIGQPEAFNGEPSALNRQPQTAQNAPAPTDMSPKDIQFMVQELEDRMQASPEDVQGWTLLARTYLSMGRYQDAIKANQHLLTIKGEDADTLSDLADSTALLNQGKLLGKPTEYLNRALAVDPLHPQSLWLAGVSALQQENPEKARAYWNKLLPLLDEASEQQKELAALIERTKMSPEELAKLREQESQAQQASSAPAESATASHSLTVSVKLDESIASDLNANDTVFVFAKAEQGPPAPLAVKRLTVGDLPTTVTLSDSDAMMPQLTISKFEGLAISARISKSGNPIAQSGDLQSEIVAVSNKTTEKIALIISYLVP